MSDTVERLRNDEGIGINLTLCREAADEIERLRGALKEIANGKRDADQSYATLLEALIKLESNCWSLVCKSYPTGDADTGYEVISYHMAKLTERVEGSGDTIIQALVSSGLLLPAPNAHQKGKSWERL